jgi:hypothetical protein
MKLLNTLRLQAGIGLTVLISLWGPTSPAQTETNLSDYFKLGEMYQASNYVSYFAALGGNTDSRFKDMADLAKTLGAPQYLLDDIDKVRKNNSALPFAKPYSDWTDEQKKLWADPSTTFSNDVWRKWLFDKQPYDYAFVYYLGRYSLEAWYGVQAGISARGNTLASQQAYIREVANAFGTLLTDSGYAHSLTLLSPDTLAAAKTIAAVKNKLDDPLSPEVNMDDVNNLGNAGKALHDLYGQKKLFK